MVHEDFTIQPTPEFDHNGDAATSQEPEFEPEITLHVFIGWMAPRTMCKMGSLEVSVLIDIGSTHNFISERLAIKLRLLVVPIEEFFVKVANEEKLKC
ncbi:hypothetical protein Pint_32081 [Pistacia integerrima]|uniref:Uncharacterized protein n=1 Tax=Pistacia integerrima TaxID=434235 RepID=A0ACC0XPU3_9ROSI|nr:hypothetical protein Pint_32081 [Pistacia integerrima]